MNRAKLIKESEVELVCARERAGSGKFGSNLRRAESRQT